MQKLIELAQKIKDVELRKKVVEFLKDVSLSNRDFEKYPKMDIEEARTLFGAPSFTSVVTWRLGW